MQRELAIITGASRGIGKAVAITLAARCDLVLMARDKTALDEVARECEQQGAVCHVLDVDITNIDEVGTRLRKIELLPSHFVHCAGQMRDSLLAMTRVTDMNDLLAVNVQATLSLCQYISKLMTRKRTGNIVLMGSAVAEQGAAGQSVYAATKGAISAFTRALAKELGPFGIRVNCVAPGFICTDLTAHYSAEKREALIANSSLRRLGTPQDIAAVVNFLCSDSASFVTGQTLAVDGGLGL